MKRLIGLSLLIFVMLFPECAYPQWIPVKTKSQRFDLYDNAHLAQGNEVYGSLDYDEAGDYIASSTNFHVTGTLVATGGITPGSNINLGGNDLLNCSDITGLTGVMIDLGDTSDGILDVSANLLVSGYIQITNNNIYGAANDTVLTLSSQGGEKFIIDSENDGTEVWDWVAYTTTVASMSEAGTLQIDGLLDCDGTGESSIMGHLGVGVADPAAGGGWDGGGLVDISGTVSVLAFHDTTAGDDDFLIAVNADVMNFVYDGVSTAMTLSSAGNLTTTGYLAVSGDWIYGDGSDTDLGIGPQGGITLRMDGDNDGTETISIQSYTAEVAQFNESGDLSLNGNLTAGNAAGDSHTVNGRMTFADYLCVGLPVGETIDGSASITPESVYIQVEGAGGLADTLSTITTGDFGDLILLTAGGENITIDEADNISVAGSSITLTGGSNDHVWFAFGKGEVPVWYQITPLLDN